MDKELIKRVLIWLAVAVAIWYLFILNGGDTVTVINRRPVDVCEVYFAFNPDEDGWGPNRLGSRLRYTHSRDLRMPIYFEWFADDPEAGYSGRVVSCEGEVVAERTGLGVDTNYELWEIGLIDSPAD